MFGFGKKKSGNDLITAMCDCNAPEVARLIPSQDFVMIRDPEVTGVQGGAPFMLEVDGFPAVVAFTSQDEAASFGQEVPEARNADGNLSAFVVGGADFLQPLPEGVGVIINPGLKNCAGRAPALVDEVKQFMPA